MVMTRERAASIKFQLHLARQAAHRGAFGAARIALSQLSPGDFAGGDAITGPHLEVLRDHRASEEAVRDAVRALVALRPAGVR
jgi:hypothetical protein